MQHRGGVDESEDRIQLLRLHEPNEASDRGVRGGEDGECVLCDACCVARYANTGGVLLLLYLSFFSFFFRYQTWLKKQLVSGYAVTWAIMWDGQTYPVYGLKPPAGMYGHYEPVIGIQSNHPLSDPKVSLPCPGSCAGSCTAPVQARVHIPLTLCTGSFGQCCVLPLVVRVGRNTGVELEP